MVSHTTTWHFVIVYIFNFFLTVFECPPAHEYIQSHLLLNYTLILLCGNPHITFELPLILFGFPAWSSIIDIIFSPLIRSLNLLVSAIVTSTSVTVIKTVSIWLLFFIYYSSSPLYSRAANAAGQVPPGVHICRQERAKEKKGLLPVCLSDAVASCYYTHIQCTK